MRANASIITPPHELLEQPRFAPEHHPVQETSAQQDDAAHTARQVAGAPPQPQTIPEPADAFDALKMIHRQSHATANGLLWLARWFNLRDRNPIFRPYLLTAAEPTALDRAQGQPARSITVLVPTLSSVANNPLFCVGIGGRSATVAGGGFLIPTLYATIPLQADDITIGFDPAGGQPAAGIPVFVLRWPTVQPFAAR